MQKSPETIAFDKNISQQRLDYEEVDGKVRAILTVTLPGGQTYVFSEDASQEEGEAVEGMWDRGSEVPNEVGSIFGDIAKFAGKAVKAVGKAAKSVATSKVFKTAAKGLAVISPALGPFAPAAMAVSAGMGTASTLLSARTAASKGNKQAAAQLTAKAAADAKRIAPKNAAKLLKIASDKSKAALALSSRAKPKKKRAPSAALARMTRTASPKALSPKTGPGRVTLPQLAAAARSGNVYVLRG